MKLLSFSGALVALKKNKRVRRRGWNGKGMYLVMFNPVAHFLETLLVEDCGEKPLLPFLLMKTADDTWVPWLASQTDILAEDWEIL